MTLTDYINNKKQYLNNFNSYVQKLTVRSYELYPDKLSELSLIRGFSIELLKELGVFYIGQQAELLLPEYLDCLLDFGLINGLNNAPIFHERWVFPIKDFDNNIINLVGYSPTAPERYLYGTGKYYDRKNDMYGMENYEIALQEGFAIYCEGITDCVAVRSTGFKNAFAACGTIKSDIKLRHLNKMPFGTIFISDRDMAGDIAVQHWYTNTCVYLSISIENNMKDIDDYINKNYNSDGSKYILEPDSEIRMQRQTDFIETINIAVDWLKQRPTHATNILKPKELKDFATLMLI